MKNETEGTRYANPYLQKAIESQKYVMHSLWLIVVFYIASILLPSMWGPLYQIKGFLLLMMPLTALSSVTWVGWNLFVGARQARGSRYAIIHLCLMLALCPLALLGAFLIPLMVNGDAMRDLRSDAMDNC